MHKDLGASQSTNSKPVYAEATSTESQIPCADRSAGEATQMTPAVEGTDQEESNRSMCGSENGLSSRSGNGKARVSKVTRRQPTEAVHKPPSSTEIAEMSKRMQEMQENLRKMMQTSKRSDTVHITEEVKAPNLDTAPANFAGNLNSN